MKDKKGTPIRVIEMLKKELEKTVRHQFVLDSGVNDTSITYYLRGLREPNDATLERLANYWGVTPAWLRGYGDEPCQELHQVVGMDDQTYREICEKFSALTPEQRQQVLSLADSLLSTRKESSVLS